MAFQIRSRTLEIFHPKIKNHFSQDNFFFNSSPVGGRWFTALILLGSAATLMSKKLSTRANNGGEALSQTAPFVRQNMCFASEYFNIRLQVCACVLSRECGWSGARLTVCAFAKLLRTRAQASQRLFAAYTGVWLWDRWLAAGREQMKLGMTYCLGYIYIRSFAFASAHQAK